LFMRLKFEIQLELFDPKLGLTYNDIIILPGFVHCGASDIDTTCRLTKNISLKVPFVSSPMDTVTEGNMAIAMALRGGIGIVHHNCSVDFQANEVRRTKRYKQGFILSPIVVSPTTPIHEIFRIKKEHGFSGIPVTDNGQIGGHLVGLITLRDIDFVNNDTMETPTRIFHIVIRFCAIYCDTCSFVGKLPIINDNRELVALISRTDLKKTTDYPHSSKDSEPNPYPPYPLSLALYALSLVTISGVRFIILRCTIVITNIIIILIIGTTNPLSAPNSPQCTFTSETDG
uniref:IMP dehydrogenase n=1 Tax=Echinostoma caproni TaxID=27848 RepID=A0A183AP24_9TREM